MAAEGLEGEVGGLPPEPGVVTSLPQRINLFWRVLKWTIEFLILVVLRWRLDIAGVAHVPKKGGALLVFNHHSRFDMVMVALPIVRRRKRPVRFLGKAEYWDTRLRPLLEATKAVPVDRSSRDARAGALDAVVEALQAGDIVAMAPEGTISESFELMPLRTGAVRAAQAAGVPVIPAIGWGTQRFAAKGHGIRWVVDIPVVMRFLDPIDIAPDDDPVEVTARLETVMRTAVETIQDRYPPPEQGDVDWWQPARLGGGAPTHEEFMARHEARLAKWEAKDARRRAREARREAREARREAREDRRSS